jgi:hypothetical protein
MGSAWRGGTPPTTGSEAWASQAVLDSAAARCVSVAGARFPGPV